VFHAKAVAVKTRQRLKKSAKKSSAGSRRAVPSRSAARGAKQQKPVRKNRQGASRGMTSKKAATRPATPRPVVAVVEQRPAVKATQRHGFKINEYIVYPAHGVGQILSIEEQEVAGYKLELFVINFLKDKMTLRVPVSKIATVGMRKLAEGGLVKRALETLKGRARIKRTMWSRRAQEYEAKINSGDIVAIAEVVRDLFRSDTQPEQSYSERQLYEAALDRLSREISAVQRCTETEAIKEIEAALAKGPRRGPKPAGEAEETEVTEEAA
jgi:CarD family transcriptional regulator